MKDKNMNKLITTVTVHFRNGEKQKVALIETYRDYVVAPGFMVIDDEYCWSGSGFYLPKLSKDNTPLKALKTFYEIIEKEQDSIFVKSITF